MSRILPTGEFLIETEEFGICELCGDYAELRPYGPNGENICFKCGMKNLDTTQEQFNKRIENRLVISNTEMIDLRTTTNN